MQVAAVDKLFAKQAAGGKDIEKVVALTRPLRNDETADDAAFKELAESFAAAPVPKDFKQRSGMSLAGADIKDLRRATIGAAEAAKKLVDPVVQAIRKLP